MRRLIATTAVFLTPLAQAQPQPAAGPPAELPAAPRARERTVAASRMDLALAYLRLERALRDRPPAEADTPTINRAFDEASLAFFSGRFSPAVKTLSALAREREGREPAASLLTAESLRVKVPAAVLHPGNAAAFTLRLEPMFDSSATDPTATVELTLQAADGSTPWRREVTLPLDRGRAAPAEISPGAELGALPRGDYTLALRAAGATLARGRLAIRDEPLEPLRDRLEAQLAHLTPAGPEHARALETARARVALLDDAVSPGNSARFLAGMDALASAVTAEAAAVARGENPYHRLAGDHWRTIAVGSARVPCRVYAPAAVVARGDPAPLILAYHGAGGDESMFFEGYGAGLLKDLADELGFIAACPLTSSAGSGMALDRILEDLRGDYALDASRIYALGHSMGAGAVAGLAAARGDRLAAACCLAGGGLTPPRDGVRRAPLLVVAAELDPLLGAARARDAARGPGVTFEEAKGWGHTLVVGARLRRAVGWLLEHRLGDP